MSNVYGAGSPVDPNDPNMLQRLAAYAQGMGYPAMNMAPAPAAGTPQGATGTAAWYNGQPRMTAANAGPTGNSVTAGPNPLANPTPVDPRLAGGGPPVPASTLDPRSQAIANLRAQLNAGPPQNVNAQPTLGPNNPLAAAASIPTNGVPPAGGNIPIGGGPGMAMESPSNPTPWFTPSNTPYAPNPAVAAPTPVRTAARTGGARTGGARIPSTARAQVPAAGPNNTFQYVVPNSTAARAPIYTAGNLGGVLSKGGFKFPWST